MAPDVFAEIYNPRGNSRHVASDDAIHAQVTLLPDVPKVLLNHRTEDACPSWIVIVWPSACRSALHRYGVADVTTLHVLCGPTKQVADVGMAPGVISAVAVSAAVRTVTV